MTLDQIIDIADAVYPDGFIRMYHDDPDRHHGDTLAQFIAIELKETYDRNATDEEQMAEAGKVMRTATNELSAVAAAFGVTPVDEDSIQITWSVSDVQGERPDLTEAQCMEVLNSVKNKHDANHGVTWGIIRSHADYLFGHQPDDDDEIDDDLYADS